MRCIALAAVMAVAVVGFDLARSSSANAQEAYYTKSTHTFRKMINNKDPDFCKQGKITIVFDAPPYKNRTTYAWATIRIRYKAKPFVTSIISDVTVGRPMSFGQDIKLNGTDGFLEYKLFRMITASENDKRYYVGVSPNLNDYSCDPIVGVDARLKLLNLNIIEP